MPRLPIQNLLHPAEGHTETLGQCLRGLSFGMGSSSVYDHCLNNYGLIVLLATGRPSLGYHVSKVLHIGAIDYVARVVAVTVVACMAAIMEGVMAVQELISYAVDSLGASRFARHRDVRVSPSLANMERPEQAFVSLVLGNCSDKELILGFSVRLGRHLRSLQRWCWAVTL